MKNFVRAAGVYNASAVFIFLAPGALQLVGVPLPYSPFWVWLPALLGLFAGIVLFISASDLARFAVFPYINGIIRLTFVAATFILNFKGTAGLFTMLLAIGDIPLGLLCVFGIPRVLGKTHFQILLNK